MMAAKSTPSLNEAPIHRSKRSTAATNSRYNQTPSSSQKKSTRKSSKSTPLHANAKSFTSKNSSTSGNKSSFSESATKLSSSNTNVNCASNVSAKNDFYPLQPSVNLI